MRINVVISFTDFFHLVFYKGNIQLKLSQTLTIAIFFITIHPSLLNANTELKIFVNHRHFDSIYSVAYNPDGKYLVSGIWDKTLKVWNRVNNKLSAIIYLLDTKDYITVTP